MDPYYRDIFQINIDMEPYYREDGALVGWKRLYLSKGGRMMLLE